MMIGIEYGLAFLGGILGTTVGMTGTFVVYGAAGLLGILLSMISPAAWSSVYQTYILGILLAPYIMFMGMGAAMAYAADHEKYGVADGMDSWKRLFGKHDPVLYLVAGGTAVISYGLKSWLTFSGAAVDTGALTIVLLSLVVRTVIAKDSVITAGSDFAKDWKEYLKRNCLALFVFSVVVSLITYMVTKWTGNFQLCFFISALSLAGSLWIPRGVPATHQVTMVVGYAAGKGCSLCVCLLLGITAHVMCNALSYLVNYARFQTEKTARPMKYGSQIDPPAVTIASLSFVIFTWL